MGYLQTLLLEIKLTKTEKKSKRKSNISYTKTEIKLIENFKGKFYEF